MAVTSRLSAYKVFGQTPPINSERQYDVTVVFLFVFFIFIVIYLSIYSVIIICVRWFYKCVLYIKIACNYKYIYCTICIFLFLFTKYNLFAKFVKCLKICKNSY